MIITEGVPAIVAPPVDNSAVRGDPGARRIGLFLCITLVLATIGAALGIGLGNISHSRYFPSASQTDVINQSADLFALYNQSLVRTNIRDISPKTREFWMQMNKPQS